MDVFSQTFPMSGIWFSLENPDLKLRGFVEHTAPDRTVLKLCCLSEREFRLIKASKTIQGFNENGEQVTLLDCFISHTQKTSINDHSEETISENTHFFWSVEVFVNYTLVGVHVQDVHDEVFQSVQFKSQTINRWLHVLYYHHQRSHPKTLVDTFYQTEIADGLSFKAFSMVGQTRGALSKGEDTTLSINLSKTSDELLSIEQAFKIGFPLLHFIPFLCNQDHCCNVIELEFDKYKHAHLFIHSSLVPRSEIPHVGDMIGINDIGDQFPKILSNWYKNYSKLRRTCKLYRNTLSESCRHDDELIAAYARILEALLDRQKHSPKADDAKAIAEAKKCLQSIDNTQIRESFLNSIGRAKDKGNKEYFTSYLKTKLGSHPYYQQLLESIRLAVDIRNDETHLNTFQPTTHRNFLLKDLALELLQALIKTKLLEMLGVTENDTTSMFSSHMHFHMHKHNFKYLGKMLVELDQGESQ